jgi:hypothetical protein
MLLTFCEDHGSSHGRMKFKEEAMRTKAKGGCKSSPTHRTWSGVLARFVQLLGGPKNPHTNIDEYVEARYVLPYMLP